MVSDSFAEKLKFELRHRKREPVWAGGGSEGGHSGQRKLQVQTRELSRVSKFSR